MRAIFGSYLWVKVSDESRPYVRSRQFASKYIKGDVSGSGYTPPLLLITLIY